MDVDVDAVVEQWISSVTMQMRLRALASIFSSDVARPDGAFELKYFESSKNAEEEWTRGGARSPRVERRANAWSIASGRERERDQGSRIDFHFD